MAKKTLQLQVESDDLTVPQDRIEGFLAKAAGLVGTMPEGQFSRLERYLAIIATNGGSGGAPIDSPTFTGVPKAPTAEKGTDTTQIATTQFVQTAIDDKQDVLNYSTADVNSYLAMIAANPNSDGFTPVGVGLGPGDSGKLITSFNQITGRGWYRIILPGADEVSVGPHGSAVGDNQIFCPYFYDIENYMIVIFCSTENNANVRYEARRIKYGNVWQPWEWVNPPMAENVEYRTTERFLGNPIYYQLINDGSKSNGDYVTLPTNIQQVIDYKAYVYFGTGIINIFPSGINNNPGSDIYSIVSVMNGNYSDRIYLYYGSAYTSAFNIRVFAKYIKTTD